jgi:valyl-tRNA synthetase
LSTAIFQVSSFFDNFKYFYEVIDVFQHIDKVISDEYVDREFGTGALKITPSHDTNDYELGKKHGLEFINIMNKNASINSRVR